MAKLKNIIQQLSDTDYQEIHDSLIEHSADKSAYLLKSLREKQLADADIMEELDVNTNAYYTLRSRLNQKIEEYLLQQMESPRTDLLKKVANINEVIFTKKRIIAVATLKKLEKELLDYDLSNELTVVYKALKKLHINNAEHYNYSQLYNKHVAYMLAVDKAEDILAEYFSKFGSYTLTGDEVEKMGLSLLHNELNNVVKLYQSHRLYVYQSCLSIFHRLFVETEEADGEAEPIEDIVSQVLRIFLDYPKDSIYYHLKLVFEFLRLEYYNYYKVYRKAERFYSEINESGALLVANFSWYTFPARFLQTKLERCIRNNEHHLLHEENESLFIEYEADLNDIPKHVNYVAYRALCCHYAGKHQEAIKWLNDLLNEVSLKKYPFAMLEIKCLLVLEYCIVREYDLFQQLINSIQRQIRIIGKENCKHIVNFTKILKIAISDTKRDKYEKIKSLLKRQNNKDRKLFSPTSYVLFTEDLLEDIITEEQN
ncbi:MAG: hypothetical protein JJT94_15235 [Bernardetiaceae bacterium]|nr:hypothetical protein [Bernardetiaceae bacterium]